MLYNSIKKGGILLMASKGSDVFKLVFGVIAFILTAKDQSKELKKTWKNLRKS